MGRVRFSGRDWVKSIFLNSNVDPGSTKDVDPGTCLTWQKQPVTFSIWDKWRQNEHTFTESLKHSVQWNTVTPVTAAETEWGNTSYSMSFSANIAAVCASIAVCSGQTVLLAWDNGNNPLKIMYLIRNTKSILSACCGWVSHLILIGVSFFRYYVANS